MEMKTVEMKVNYQKTIKLRHIFLLVGLCFLLSACTPFNLFSATNSGQYTTNDPNSDLNNPYIPYSEPIVLPATLVLAPGFSANFSNGVSMSFVEVFDNRCPSGASCVQAGDATVQLQFIYNNQVQQTTLSTNNQASPFLIQGLSIQLHEIRPYPVFGRQTNKNDFRIIVHAVEQ